MATAPSYREKEDAQIPALALLNTLGYTVLSPQEANIARQHMHSRVILTTILKEQLKTLNHIHYKNKTYAFSPENIDAATDALQNLPNLGLVRTNEKAYDLLTLGKSLEQTVAGDRKSFTIKYIDWENWHQNVFHVVPEFDVAGLRNNCRCDLVLFVNGIPLAVIECKRRDKTDTIENAISDLIYYQKPDSIPQLFHYAQLVIAAQPNEVMYATVGTARKYWGLWREDGLEKALKPYLQSRLPTEQDRTLYALSRPERLMELSYQYTLFDAGEKKIARYQQYFAVQKTIHRVKSRALNQARKGGVIWHTQGSGKSLTMVMLAKALSLDTDIINPRVVLVTDQINLDDQICGTFRNCGKYPVQARTGNHLLSLLSDNRNEIVTTVLNKFDAILNRKEACNTSSEIFVLVDEAHRSHYNKMHQRMKHALPNACLIGFTGTPLLKRDKNTMTKFGLLIDNYTITQAEKDKAVVPLLYEGRHVLNRVNKHALDRGLSRVAEGLSDYQTSQLKKRSASEEKVFEVDQNIEEIAYDITQHYVHNWQGTGFKAQLAAPFKDVAVQFHEIFEREGKIKSAVVISGPYEKEDNEENEEEPTGRVQRFWNKMMQQHGSEEAYNKEIIANFKNRTDGIELLIVVGKLLTGFDAPRNTILYIAKKLKDHNLLQAVARVNRPFEGKDYGYIIDYRGVLGNLDSALSIYSSLDAFDHADVQDTFQFVEEEIAKLPQYHSNVWDTFKTIDNPSDPEALERFLIDKEIRHDFYDHLSLFARTLQTALASDTFYQHTSEDRIARYNHDLKFFESLRQSVRNRYAESLDFKEYETRVQKLLDTHVSVDDVVQVTELVNIFDKEAFQSAVADLTGTTASKADWIAHRVKRTLTDREDEDSTRFKKFSAMIEEIIQNFRQKRISETEYFTQTQKLYDNLVDDSPNQLPTLLQKNPEARAYYGAIIQTFENNGHGLPEMQEDIAQAGVDINMLIDGLKIVDWKRNPDIEKQMRNAIEDRLIALSEGLKLNLSFDEIDLILDQTIQIAKST